MIKIYHNPRCGKSREGLTLVEQSGKPFEVIKYLDQPLTESELNDLIEKLSIKPIDLVRQKEEIWIENYKGKKMTDKEVIMAMVENPKLIERPIVINGNKAVIGRPPEKIITII
ncbi:arsenate reductase (glutaredoxin) [Flavobacterium sp. '19STA2R22 D10 B1']|uniref:arsenate reductase (glutaredoxin) n=1 Tax=Flavobacterium aerium TaxID=3037261 RepID=UPI00278BFD9A|nr:arsenate reductase (glutaredoxin) [Flavobacterium sp. '19STA2R22 D10 B1']